MQYQKKNKQSNNFIRETKNSNKTKQRYNIKVISNRQSNLTSYQQNNGSQQSIIYQHLDQFDEVPPLLDLSLENAQLGTERTVNTKNKKHVDSIYIEQSEENDTIDLKNLNNLSLQDTQIPQTFLSMQDNISRMRTSRQTVKKQNQKQENLRKSYLKNKKLYNMALQIYQQTLNQNKYIPMYSNKSSEEIVLSLLTNSQKCTAYRKYLGQQRIWASHRYMQDSLRQLDRENTRDDNNRGSKDMLVMGILQCLLSKIQETKSQNHIQGFIDKKGQLHLNLNSSLSKLQKFRRDKKNSKLAQNSLQQRKDKIQKALQQQEKMLQTIKESYEDIINDYAASIHNLLEKKSNNSIRQAQNNKQPKYMGSQRDEELERIVLGNQSVRANDAQNRTRQSSTYRVTFTKDNEY